MYTINDLPNGNIAMRVTNKELALEILYRAFPLDDFTTNNDCIKEGILIACYDPFISFWIITEDTNKQIIDDENIVIEELNNFQLINK